MSDRCAPRAGVVMVALAALLPAQVAPPRIIFQTPPAGAQPKPPAPAPGQPAPAQPAPAQPAPPAGAPPTTLGALTEATGYRLVNVSLVEFVDILARRLKINYILDPRVKGSVTVNTYGEVRSTDLMQLLETVLRINGAAIVQVGSLYRIVPVNTVPQLPLKPTINGKDLPEDERMVLNLIFLKFANVAELSKLLQPFLGEGATASLYEPANLLLLLDNARNMNRTMELIALFDSDSFAGQRVRSFEVSNGRPGDIVKELEAVFKAYSLSEKSSAVRFLAIDRINTIIAVASNPGVFKDVENWLMKLDIPEKITAGAVDNYVYRLKYGRAETVAMAIMMLYGAYSGYGSPYGGMGFGGMGFGGMGMGGGMGFPGMGMGMGMGGGGYGGMGMAGGGMGYQGGPGAYGGGGYGMYGGGYPTMGYSPMSATPPQPQVPAGGGVTAASTAAPGTDLTGSYLGSSGAPHLRMPRVVPNFFDNTLLIQGTPQEWEQISKLLRQLDVPPRQVLIEAKIYEVSLTGQFASGVQAALQKTGTSNGNGESQSPLAAVSRIFQASTTGATLVMSAGMLVGQSRELLAALAAQESNGRAKIISAPSLITTDSIPAKINVGQEVPTLSSQAVAGGVQQEGSSLFTNTITNRSSGVTLQILARVNSSGIVTMMLDQEVSVPVAPPAGAAIQSPSFTKRNVQTQVTVQDGDMIAIGGIIQESETLSSAGVPVLHRIPVIGVMFGSKLYSKERTELLVFLTPRVIYDTNQVRDATEEMTSKLKRLQKLIKE